MRTISYRLSLFILFYFAELNPSSSAFEPSPAVLLFHDREETGRAFPVRLTIAGSGSFPDLHLLSHPDDVWDLPAGFPVHFLPVPVEHPITAPGFIRCSLCIGENAISANLGVHVGPGLPDAVEPSRLSIVRDIESPGVSALSHCELSTRSCHDDIRILHQDLHPLLDQASRAVCRKAGCARAFGLDVSLIGNDASRLSRRLSITHGTAVAVMRDLQDEDLLAEVCDRFFQSVRTIPSREEPQLREIAAERAVVREGPGVSIIVLREVCGLLAPNFELDVSECDVPAFCKVVDLGASPPSLIDTGIQVIEVVLHGPAVSTAPDPVLDSIRIIAEKSPNIKIAVLHDHFQTLVVVVVRMGQHQVQILVFMLLQITDKSRCRRPAVKPIDDECLAGIAVDHTAIPMPLIVSARLKSGNKNCDSHTLPLKSS